MSNAHLIRPVPEDFAEMRAKLGSIVNLRKHYKAHTTTVSRWMDEAGLPRMRAIDNLRRNGCEPPNKKPIPDDFAQVAPTMHKTALCRHYGAVLDTVNRWLRDAGVSAARAEAVPFKFSRAPSVSNIALTKTYGREDWAADVLRKWGAVYRCRENGRPDEKGKFWRSGNIVLTGPELIERAERKAARVA